MNRRATQTGHANTGCAPSRPASENIVGTAQSTLPKARSRRLRKVCYGLAVLAALGVSGYFGVPHLLGFYHWHAAQKAQESREFAVAHAHLARCLSVWPHGVATQLAAARAARRAGLLQEADEHLRACQDSEEQTSDEWRLQYNLLAVKRDGLNPLQEKYLQDALRQGCSDPLEVMEALSEEYLRRDRYSDAQALLEAWLEMRPDDVEALARRGWVWDHLFHFDRTRADY